jgi:Kef-type K+ transport system membrane component KefB
MSGNGQVIPQLLILGIGIFCAAVTIYSFPSPRSSLVLGLILAAIATAIIASVTVEVLP